VGGTHPYLFRLIRVSIFYRYLDPDPSLLVDEVNSRTNPKFHALNEAVVQLVRPLVCPHRL
jgi:hypothetical protein